MLIGHEKIISYLDRLVFFHSAFRNYCFVGPSRVGKKMLAIHFAKALFCEKGKTIRDTETCECPSCEAITRGLNPDLVLFAAAEEEKEIGVARVKELKRALFLAPARSFRIVIIDEAERLTQESSNALLKILEEAAGRTMFILIAGRERLLGTVASRLEQIRFGRLSVEEQGRLFDILKGNAAIRDRAVYLSLGKPGLLTELIKNDKIFKEHEAAFHDLVRFLQGSFHARLSYFDRIKEEEERDALLLDSWPAFASDLVLSLQGAHVLPPSFEKDTARIQVSLPSLSMFLKTLLLLEEARTHTTLNKKLMFDQLAMI